jgi:hypothetical protein
MRSFTPGASAKMIPGAWRAVCLGRCANEARRVTRMTTAQGREVANVCVPQGAACLDDDGCGSGEHCADYVCQANDCRDSDDCGDDSVCREGRCLTACVGEAECRDGDSCRDGACEPDNECQADGDCPVGTPLCREGTCYEDPSCERWDGCPDELLCIDGLCVGGACLGEGDCERGQLCIQGQCVLTGQCLNDDECPDGSRCVDFAAKILAYAETMGTVGRGRPASMAAVTTWGAVPSVPARMAMRVAIPGFVSPTVGVATTLKRALQALLVTSARANACEAATATWIASLAATVTPIWVSA